MTAEIQDVIVILPGMVAWNRIQRADISTLSGHGKGFEESILRILHERDKARSGWIPSFAEEVKTARGWASVGMGNTGHLFQSHDQLGTSGVHVHLPDTCLARGVLVLVNVVNADIV